MPRPEHIAGLTPPPGFPPILGRRARGLAILRSLLWPGLATLLGLLVLLALGFWQVRRLAWKEGILAQIAAAEAAPAIPLPAHPGPFQKVSVSGRFLAGPIGSYGIELRDLPTGPVLGWQHLAPFETTGGRLILVDRGWVPDGLTLTRPEGTVTVVGYARPAEHPRMFGASDDPAARQFFTLDPVKIAAALGRPGAAPFTLVTLGPERPGVFPDPAQHLPRPPNNHRFYAATWFGLAGLLVVMFASWVPGRLSE